MLLNEGLEFKGVCSREHLTWADSHGLISGIFQTLSNVLPVIEVWCLLWLKLTFVAFYIFEGVYFHFSRKGIGGEDWSAELYVQIAKVFQQQSLPVYIRSSCASARIMSCSFFLSWVGTDQWTNIESYIPSSVGVWIGWFHLISFPFFKHSFIHITGVFCQWEREHWSECNLWELALSFHHASSKDWTLVIRFGGKCLFIPSHLTGYLFLC